MRSEPLVSWELEAAIVGVAAMNRAGQWLGAVAIPALPTLPDPLSFLSDSFDHAAAALFRQREDGLFVPAAPALVTRSSGFGPVVSGPGPARIRTPRPGEWSDAIDVAGMVAFLSRAHGHRKVAESVAAATGEPLSTVRKWFALETKPGFRATLVLVCVYGPDLLEAALRRQPAWFTDIRSGADRIRLAGELSAMRARIDEVLA